MEKLYTASVTASGGRNGVVKSEDGVVNFEVRMPKALGGKTDEALNPELLFAAGYSACFDSALQVVLAQHQQKAETSVNAQVSIGKTDDGGFGLAAILNVNIAGVELATARELVEKAHQICPYSIATRGNMEVELNVTNQ